MVETFINVVFRSEVSLALPHWTQLLVDKAYLEGGLKLLNVHELGINK